MANSTEYSRLVFKRSTVAGIVPTIPTGTTIDSSWLTTDILIGEAFINVTDDRFWFRTDNGIIEVDLSGQTADKITTGATLVGNTIYFETLQSASAYTVDLSSIIVTGGTGNYLPLSGGTLTGALTATTITATTINTTTLQITSGATNNYLLTSDANGNASWKVAPTGLTAGSFGITIDGGGSAITTGVKGYITIPYNGTITGWDIFGDTTGSTVVDVWKDTFANFPPTVADTIAGSEKPTLSSAIKNQDRNLTTWTTAVTAGDIIGFNVESASVVTRVNLIIYITKS